MVEIGWAWHAVERKRVREHFLRVDQLVRQSCPAGLGRATRRARALILSELARYRTRGRFPKNRDFASRTPYFIDADGTRCAVAHLLEVTGEAKLVRKIARERNNARVPELANEPRLVAWLRAAGLTLEEAAAIQPAYECVPPTACYCDSRPGTVLEAVALTDAMNGKATASVVRVHRGGEGLQAGDTIEMLSTTAVSGSELVAAGWWTSSNAGLDTLGSEVTFPASSCGFQLSRNEYLWVAAASDCPAALSRIDPNAAANDCDDGGCSCAVPGAAGGSTPTSLGILMALMSAAALRRSRRRRSSTR